jgi:uncharacterized protein YndB with AHSA1/START domain
MATEAGRALELQLRRTFDAPPERVFRAWTEAEAMMQWQAPFDSRVTLLEVDVRVGGRYRVHMEGKDGTQYRLTGEYREVVKPGRLVYTWHWETDPAEKESLVTVEFRDLGGRTELTLTHSGFANESERSGHDAGWQSCMEKVAALI